MEDISAGSSAVVLLLLKHRGRDRSEECGDSGRGLLWLGQSMLMPFMVVVKFFFLKSFFGGVL